MSLLEIFVMSCSAIEPINSNSFKEDLLKFYKEKYNTFNSNINIAGQTKLLKTIYLES